LNYADHSPTTPKHDLAAQHPEVVRALAWEYQKWAVRNDVVDYEIIKPATLAEVDPPLRRVVGGN
jgi:hypothetical protein